MPALSWTEPQEQPWTVVVPLKGGAGAKSRLAPAGRPGLARAMAADTLAAILAVVGARRTLVVTSDEDVCRLADSFGVARCPDPGSGLDAAAYAGIRSVRSRARTQPDHAVAVLLGDHPALRATELGCALRAAARHRWAFVPDKAGTGTAMVTTVNGLPRLSFGPGSAARHRAEGLACLDLDLPGLRLDVDTVEDLRAAQALGVGPRTAKILTD